MLKTKTKPAVKLTQKVLEKKLTDDQLRIRILKTELHYFKGLAIMVVLMTLCVFVAFGVLFSAMYIETRATRLVIEKAMSEILPKNFESSIVITDDNVETQNLASPPQTTDVASEPSDAIAKIKWLFFEKYGYRVYFPNSWTFLDKPFQKQIYFFSDGEVRENDSDDIGNFVTAIVDKDNYREKYQGELISAAGTVGISYAIEKAQTVIVVPFSAKYLEIRSSKKDLTLTSDLMKAMASKIEFVK
jgi:hypothetical protein